MITVGNGILSVELLDPNAAHGRLGARYCHGGYIWQIKDGMGRPMLSGPHYPDPDPAPFDGQGMPEAFKTPELAQPCIWDIGRGDDYAVMTARQDSIKLRREVRVCGNKVESVTTVDNISGNDVKIRWFSHPFFPLNDDLACGKINAPVSVPENAGYAFGDDGMVRMKPDYPWQKGLFQPLEVPREKLIFTVPHPVAGSVELSTDYDVAYCPVWANKNTFSFEPFMERVVGPGEAVSWGVAVRFLHENASV